MCLLGHLKEKNNQKIKGQQRYYFATIREIYSYSIFLVLVPVLMTASGCSLVREVGGELTGLQNDWRISATAAQHRQPAKKVQSHSLKTLDDSFLIERRQNFSLPISASVAVAFESFQKKSLDQDNLAAPLPIDKALTQVAEDAFRQHFPAVKSMAPQSYDSAKSEALHRAADYLSFMRITHWAHDNRLKWLACDTSTRPESKIRTGILPESLKQCQLDVKFPRNQVVIQFWLVHIASGYIVDSGNITGTSGWLNFTGAKPEQLMAMPMASLASGYLGEAP